MSGPAARSLPGLAVTLARQWWPQLAALAAACAVVATTVVGAAGVGDAIRRGLLDLAVGRLGRIDAAVVADDFFRRTLAAETALGLGSEPAPSPVVVPALVVPVSAEASRSTGAARATLLACDDPAALGFDPPPPAVAPGTILVNAAFAAAVGVGAGESVVLRMPRRSSVPADNPLGRRTDESIGRRVTVAAVLPERGLGRFSLRPTQVTAPLVVMSLADAQAIVRRGDVANVLFAAGGDPAADTADRLRRRLRPRLDDYGLTIEAAAAPDADATAGVARLTSRRLVIPPAIDAAAAAVLAPLGGRASLAFLANDMAPLDDLGRPATARIPYSTVLGIDGTTLPTGGLVGSDGETLAMPAADEIIIDRWMADDLASQGRPVAVGDRLAVSLFLPETIHGRVEETTAIFRIAGIAEMRGTAVARSLVPTVEGVSDEESIADWDPPFPFDQSRVRTVPPHDEDDRYWKTYRATPKAFVSLATARRLAGSRFGGTTAWHVPCAAAADAEAWADRLAAALAPTADGFSVMPLRAEAVAAARGSTPFGGLFLALSGFVVAAGLLLVWLLFGLLVAAQRPVIGLLAAVGWPPARLGRLLLAVGGVAAVVGAVVGAALGLLWARGLLFLLGTAWNRDVASGSTAVFTAARPGWWVAWPGLAATLALAVAALAVAARRAGRLPPQELLAGSRPERGADTSRGGVPGRWSSRLAAVALVLAAGAAVAGRGAEAGAAVGLFFTSGFAALAGLLAMVRRLLAAPAPAPARSLPQLARRLLAARPARAFSIAAIVACGQFLVVAVSAFTLRPPSDPHDRRSPTGGWTTIATFGTASSVDPSDADARGAIGLSSAQQRALAGCTIARLRSSDGDDASCTNLYAAGRPAVVGVGPDFVARGGFRFVAHARPRGVAANAVEANPWTLLGGAEAGAPIPAILDQATAQWGLKLGGVGSRFSLADGAGEPVGFEIVGLLEPGILQGRVIVAERDFERTFPSRSGYALALVDASRVAAADRADLAGALRVAWGDAGVSLESTVDRLRSLMAVQNTFLAGFQALGTLGLLLGTAGVAAVQLQGVVERLGGFALLRAVGFTLARVRLLLVLETIVTVGIGLVVGTVAGTLAVWPALAAGTARVPLLWIAATCGLTLAVAAAAGRLATMRTAIPERPR